MKFYKNVLNTIIITRTKIYNFLTAYELNMKFLSANNEKFILKKNVKFILNSSLVNKKKLHERFL